MNVETQSFINVLAEDGAKAILGQHGGIDAIQFANGATVAWRCPGSFSDRETSLAIRQLRTVARAHADIAKVQADETRTDAWKAEQTTLIAEKAEAAFESARADPDKLIADFAEADRLETRPPPLASGDLVGGLLDREIRDEVRRLDSETQTELAKELLEGKHPATLAALLRSPWPLRGVLADVLNEAWQRQLLASDPRAAKQRQRAVERVTWLRQALEQAQRAMPSRAPHTLMQQRDRAIADRAA